MGPCGRFLADNWLWWAVPIVLVLATIVYVVLATDTDGDPGQDVPFVYDAF